VRRVIEVWGCEESEEKRATWSTKSFALRLVHRPRAYTCAFSRRTRRIRPFSPILIRRVTVPSGPQAGKDWAKSSLDGPCSVRQKAAFSASILGLYSPHIPSLSTLVPLHDLPKHPILDHEIPSELAYPSQGIFGPSVGSGLSLGKCTGATCQYHPFAGRQLPCIRYLTRRTSAKMGFSETRLVSFH
jgi:hypothetical protein